MRRGDKEASNMKEELEAINSVPHLKAQFDALNRDYEITEKTWEFKGGVGLIIPGTNYILSPWNGFDYGDEVVFLGGKNLKEVHSVDVLGGPGVTVYEKINAQESSLMLYEYTGDGRYILYQI